MSDWILQCDCCGSQIKKIQENYTWSNVNLDGTPHEKHYKIWVSSVANYTHYHKRFEQMDPTRKLGDMTIEEFEKYLDGKLNAKFGQYYHGQKLQFKEKWLKPKYLSYQGIDFYVSGKVDAIVDQRILEFKTTWAQTKTKMKTTIAIAETQANLYAWVSGISDIIIEIKNLLKPELDFREEFLAEPEKSPELIYNFIDKNREIIKQY